MPTTTNVPADQISRCRHCDERIGWLPSRRGMPYPVNLVNDGQAVTNDFHACPRQDPPQRILRAMQRPAAARSQAPAPAPAPVTPAAPGQYPPTPGITAMLANRGLSTPPTFESVVDLRKAVMAALDFYCVAYARLAVETTGGPLDTAMAGYWRQMKDHINTQIDDVKTAYATPVQAPPPPPASASLDAVVAATHDRQIDDTLSPDYAGGPEPVPGWWDDVPPLTDDDIPF